MGKCFELLYMHDLWLVVSSRLHYLELFFNWEHRISELNFPRKKNSISLLPKLRKMWPILGST